MNKFKNPMFAGAACGRKSLFVPAALIITSFLCLSVANAQDATCPYTAASLQGSYGMVGYYTGGIALAIAVESFDDSGNLTRKAIVNAPPAATAPTGAPRVITPTTSTGTFTVNCDGTGTYSRVLTNMTTGVTSNFTGNFVITRAVLKDGQMIATSFTDAQVEGSAIVPGGVFVYYVHTRLPDAPAAPSSSSATSAKSVKKGT
jgi:hypothetical protein